MEATSTPRNPLAAEGTFKQRMKYRILLGAVQGGFALIGCYLAWTSTGLFFLQDSKIIYTPQQASWVGSLFPLGAVLDNIGPFKEPTIMMLALVSSYPLFLLFTVPESPVWLTARGRKEEAGRASKKLLVNYVNLDSTESVKPFTSAGLRVEVLQRMENKGKLFLILSLVILQQICGIGPITFYAKDIIGIITKHQIYSWVFVIAMALLWIIAPVVIQNLVKRLGEKCLLIISTFFTAVFLFLLAGYTISDRSPNPILTSEAVALALLLFYMAAFHIGIGPVPWIMIGKMFPGKVKKTIYNLALTCGWTTLFITTKTFCDMLIVMDIYVLLIIYGLVNVAGMFFVAFAVPRIIDEIDECIVTDLNEIH
ncbi:hypothetical protein KPH14_005876 [Odynerus spinipes]|uniref:Uncharacterized protein n=1 Tax=Odynerus spinipes TaxID=1348599 RepID=A0AAD9RCB9_9HYME|nr:hypothetical protein KPH14_005876 [Odynerus spinipes]